MRDPPERLRKAVIEGNLPITKRLLARFPDLWLNTDPGNNGWCNLHYASFKGNYLVCFHLLSLKRRSLGPSKHSEMDMLTFDNLTVLHMPIFRHHSQTLHYLLQEFAGHTWINHKGGKDERTPLHYCCACSFTDGLKLLLEFGADWKMTDKNGDTCLHLCFSYGNINCLRELVKCIVAKCARSLHDVVGEPQFSGKEAILAELSEFESIKNRNGFRAIDYASSFELQAQYKESRLSWVNAALEEEALLQKLSLDNWDSVLEFTPSENNRADSASLHPSTQSSASSLTAPDSASMTHSSSTGIRPSALPERSDEALAKPARLHLASVGNDPSHLSPQDKLGQRRRSNTAAVHGYKPPPLPIAISTHTSLSGSSKSAMKMSSPVTPLLTDFPKTPSLKSITISPSVRGSKRRTSINSIVAGTPEVREDLFSDQIVSPYYPEQDIIQMSAPATQDSIPLVSKGGQSPNPASTSQLSASESRRRSMSAYQSPPIRSSSIHFLPLGITRRRSATSAATGGANPSYPEGVDGLRPSSPLTLESSRFSSQRNSLRRNISTPSVSHTHNLGMSSANASSETIPNHSVKPERLFRHANVSDSVLRSRPTSPMESAVADFSTLMDTIKLNLEMSHDSVPENQIVHSFVASIPFEKTRRSYTTTSPNRERENDRAYFPTPQTHAAADTSRTSTMSSLSSIHSQRDLNSIKLTRVRDD